MVRALTAFRLFTQVSQEKLALTIHESQPVISRIELGKVDLSIDFAPRYAQGCGGLTELDSLIESLQILRALTVASAFDLHKEYRDSAKGSMQLSRSR